MKNCLIHFNRKTCFLALLILVQSCAEDDEIDVFKAIAGNYHGEMRYESEPNAPFSYDKGINFMTDVTVTKNNDEYTCVFSDNGIIEIPELHFQVVMSTEWFAWLELDGDVKVFSTSSIGANMLSIRDIKNIGILLDFHQYHNTDSAYHIWFNGL